MPVASPATTVRQSVLRRRRKKKRVSSKRNRRSFKGTTQRKTSGVPLAFQEFNRAKMDAEFRGITAFKWNGGTYQRHEWTNGVPVWKRA